jgi:hypothetical protein
MERMSHSEYISSLRLEAARVAAAALAGRVDLLEASHKLASLLAIAELEPGDADAATFSLISSETDALPVGAVRHRWEASALDRLQPEIESARARATPIATPAPESVVRRCEA